MKNILLLFLLQLIAVRTQATVFVVTSNADSGPGTLRAALTSATANGTAITDYINFNIADQTDTGRTITLLSKLPGVSSNLVIDGTTQPGVKFGASDAKIKLTGTINITSSKVEIYGLWLVDNWQQVSTAHTDTVGINIVGGANITIGAPGKGNLIDNCFYGINIGSASAITIQANIMGLNSDGMSSFKNHTAIKCTNVDNLTIGGTQPNEGNVLSDYGQTEVDLTECTNINVGYNLLGTDITGNATTGSTFIGTTNNSSGVTAVSGSNLTINNNIFAGLGEALVFAYVNLAYTIANNKFGIGLSGNALGNRLAITIADCTAKGTISNNIIFYNEQAIDIYGSNAATITKNSFDCNIKPDDIDYSGSSANIPYITVDSKSGNQISGKATANSMIELFYTGVCGCHAKTYIATVQADDLEKWSYNASLSPQLILATATDQNGATSAFSIPTVIAANVIVKSATCGNNGSITGMLFNNATDTYWMNVDDGSIIKQNDITGLPPGKYVFNVTNGVCTSSSMIYEVKDDKVNVDASHALITDALCGLPAGSITGITVTTTAPYYNAAWRSESGEVVADTLDFVHAKPGKYTLEITPPGRACAQTFTFTVGNSSLAVAAPNVDDMLLCNPGDATITVSNPSPGFSYYLYENEFSNTPIDDEPSGKFKVNVKSNRSYYITQHKGTCESSRTEVKITVLNTTLNVANTFTPNGDGINDTWTIGGIENFPSATVQLYTRSGEKVFETEKYTTPFNGIYKGKLLPIGTYYYIINLKIPGSQCGLVSGSLTIVR